MQLRDAAIKIRKDMGEMIIRLLIVVMLMGCAGGVTLKSTPEMVEIYPAWYEISYCLSPEMEITNIVEGNFMWVYLAFCNHGEIVMHTHPWWGDAWASLSDVMLFNDYHELYGNELFGVQFAGGTYTVYTIKGER